MFELPPGLNQLIASGVWPSAAGPSMTAQQLNPTIPAERVQRFAEDESLICLQPTPFPTIAQLRAAGRAGDFWERFGSLDQIDPERAVVIGDFGMGSDSPVVLDFARDASNPPVLRLNSVRHGNWYGDFRSLPLVGRERSWKSKAPDPDDRAARGRSPRSVNRRGHAGEARADDASSLLFSGRR